MPLRFPGWMFLLAAWITSAAMPAGETTAQVLAHGVVTAADWQVRPGDEAVLGVQDLDGWLRVRCHATEGSSGQLRLRTPIALPAWASDLSFIATNNGATAALRTFVLIRDADGAEFRYYTSAPPSYERGLVQLNARGHRAVAVRHRTPGIARPKPEPLAAPTLAGGRPGALPKAPLTWVGLQFDGAGQEGQDAELYLRGFQSTAATPANTRLHYLWHGQECFLEADGPPSITPAEAAHRWYGQDYRITWEARSSYAGQPVLSGSAEVHPFAFEWSANGDGARYPIAIAQPIVLPITRPGTWWIRVTSRWSRGGAVPDEITEEDHRLDIISGDAGAAAEPLPAAVRPVGGHLRLAADASELIFPAATPQTLQLSCWKPEVAVDRVRVELLTVPPQVWEAVPQWNADAFVMPVPLPALAMGAYRIRATLLAGEHAIDRIERTIGMRGKPCAIATPPAGVATWQQVLSRREPMFSLSAMLPDDARVINDADAAWNELHKPFLDRAGEVSREVELPAPWRQHEPLPGVYDWRALDRFLDYAAGKGLQVIIRPEFRAWDSPDWIAGSFERNAAGLVQGHPSYTFQGGRLNLVHDPGLRAAWRAYMTELTRHLVGHPALQGYMVCYEAPGDALYAGWREGYAAATTAAFRAAMAARPGGIAAANRRWGTAFAGWPQVAAPVDGASPALWLDWLRFRCTGVDDLLKEFVTIVRAGDQRRILVMYRDGIVDTAWFRDHGCSFANGGSHDAMGLLEYAACDLDGTSERTEDHSPGDWTAYFPSQPDASVFAMLAGGWRNTSCKAFVFTNKHFADLADPDRSLGRYRRLLPLWSELRQTRPIGYQVQVVDDQAGQLLQDRGMVTGQRDPWETLNLAQAQVPACLARAAYWPRARLLLTGRINQVMERQCIDQLVAYVDGGGTLLMRADAGRTCIEDPAADWVLLERLGFVRPAGAMRPDAVQRATPREGGLWGQPSGVFQLRDCWKVAPPADAQTEARFDDGSAAISWKAHGKGRVVVMWAQTLMPPMYGTGSGAGFPFYRALAAWAQVDLPTASDNHLFWTNFLVGQQPGVFYGLAHLGNWQGQPAGRESTRLHWSALPPGTFRVDELLSGRQLGSFARQQLADQGLPLELGAREAAILRFTLTTP